MKVARMKAANDKTARFSNGANVGFEALLWQMVDALRGTLQPKLILL